MKRLSFTAKLVVLAGLLFSGFLVTTGSASADATGCEPSHSAGKTCFQVWGDSVYVTRSHTTHNHWHAANSFCGYKAKNWGVLPSGRTYVKTSPTHSGCSYINAWVDMTIERSFKNDTGFCGQFYHDGAWSPGNVCHRIKA